MPGSRSQKGSLMVQGCFLPCYLLEAGRLLWVWGTTEFPSPRVAQGIWEDTEHVIKQTTPISSATGKTAIDQTKGKLLTLEVLNRWD